MDDETSAPATSTVPAAPLKNLRALEFGLIFLIVFAPLLAMSIYTVTTGSNLGGSTPGKAFTLSGILTEVSALALLRYVLLRQGRDFRSLGLWFSWKDILRSVLIIVLGYIAFLVWWFSIVAIYRGLGRPLNSAPQNVEFMSSMLSILGVLFLLLNPFFEELIVRAYVISEVQFFTGSSSLAVLVSVAIQSSYHLYQGVVPALLTTSLFTVFSLYYVRTKRITPVIIAHMFFDFLALAVRR
jgi:membrane protease YdiL (CAAX protease family)